MTRYQRLNALLELVAERGALEVSNVAVEMSVSTATIRRDLDHLADQQLVMRTRGGAIANSIAADLPLRYKTDRNASEKQRIGRIAASLISDGMVVGLNGGTTTTEAARALALRSDTSANGQSWSATVVTNALNLANELVLRRNLKVVAVGGVARPQSYELIGPLATLILNVISIDLLLLGVDALDWTVGAGAHNEGEASINALMVSRAERVVALADSSKLGRKAFAQICPTDQISTVITDTGADPAAIRAFEAQGIEVMAV